MKHGKKYIEAAKNIERGNLYGKEEAIALVKKTAVAKFDETIEAHIRTVEQLYCHTELVRKFVSWYSLRMLRLKKLKQLVLIT